MAGGRTKVGKKKDQINEMKSSEGAGMSKLLELS